MDEDDSFDVSPRDIAILKARVDHPTSSTRELSGILEEEYGISLSHNRINEILRTMSEQEIFRETILPNREIFRHYLFRIGFNFTNFEENWRDCYFALQNDPHVLMFFTADSSYHWHVITQFRTDNQMERWVHEFFKAHGDLIGGFHNTMLHSVHKFQTEAAVFDDILAETEEGRQYLDHESD
ncbi:helix-turn-helix domain-containing protein [Haloterrigena alkaliphila]|uniref:Helix-turn-helix domain-containing protein n=1 Tax=Haloterrigena alkaliphila TaxID=2816475 RepID=A0A8A2VBB7_9EURY|nr:helix-turn-helix domain-containing protein [Haloterrigena alkaliphila]QSW97722.1 helix-turn-helix domain-containing protein [Haloterrigena alkaliphila]